MWRALPYNIFKCYPKRMQRTSFYANCSQIVKNIYKKLSNKYKKLISINTMSGINTSSFVSTNHTENNQYVISLINQAIST